MNTKTIIVLGLLSLFIICIVAIPIIGESNEPLTKVCDSIRFQKGYTGESHCYDYDILRNEKRLVEVND